MANVGRKGKYNPEIVKEIAHEIAEGNTQEDAAILAGINRSTFYQWMATRADFSDAIQSAHATFKQREIQRIRAAGVRVNNGKLSGSWQADAWLMERKYPDEFGQRVNLKVSPEDYDLLRKAGFNSPSEAFAQLLENVRKEFSDAKSNS